MRTSARHRRATGLHARVGRGVVVSPTCRRRSSPSRPMAAQPHRLWLASRLHCTLGCSRRRSPLSTHPNPRRPSPRRHRRVSLPLLPVLHKVPSPYRRSTCRPLCLLVLGGVPTRCRSPGSTRRPLRLRSAPSHPSRPPFPLRFRRSPRHPLSTRGAARVAQQSGRGARLRRVRATRLRPHPRS